VEKFAEFFNMNNILKPYENYDEYLKDNFSWVEIISARYIVFINEVKKFDTNMFYDRKKIQEEMGFSKETALKDFRSARFFINNRVKANKKIFYSGEYMIRKYKLSTFEWFCVIALISCKVSNRLRKLFGGINDFFEQKKLNLKTLYKIYNFSYEIDNVKSDCKILDDAKYKLGALCFEDDKFEVSSRIFDFIIYNSEKNLSLSGAKVVLPTKNVRLCIREDIAVNIKNFITSSGKRDTVFIYIQGDSGIGKRTIIKRVAEIQEEALTMINISKCHIDDKEKFKNILITCFREATLNGGYIGIIGLDILYADTSKYQHNIDFIFDKIGLYARIIFMLSDTDLKKVVDLGGDRFLQINLENLDSQERLTLWTENFEGIKDITNVKAVDMSNKFDLNPGQIVGTINRAQNLYLSKNKKKLDEKEMCECAYSQVVNTLSEKAVRLKSKHTWEDLVLNPKEKEMLKNACAQVKYKHIVYDKWKMKNRIFYGKGISMLFAGPPGTGKTMAAGVIANDLGLEIYRVDLSQIVSKYIGETEKNLNSIFNEAKSSNVILFFDETDALFGKRTEVKDSHDKNANIETSFLLQKMEEYEGITIMTTNFLQNIDSAFFRRISYVIHFEFPDKESRRKIWGNMYPESVPRVKDIDFEYLARQFEIAGGNIKNIALTSLFLAAKSEEKILNMKHILTAIKYELKKQGKTLLKEDFNEYGYIMENKGK
jgi:AAA+ superfamily predicted ATPase